MDLLNRGTWKPLFLPGGALLLAALVLLAGGLISVPAPAMEFYYYAVFVAGVLLAWRFHSTRILSALIVLLLAHRALEFFSNGRIGQTGPGRIAYEVLALLLPLNFILLAQSRERGITLAAALPRLTILFFESVFVAVLCRPGEVRSPAIVRAAFLYPHLFSWTQIPQLALLAFSAAFVVAFVRFFLYRKPLDSGLLWSLGAILLGFQSGGIGRLGSAYFATAGLILLSSIIENSYVLAYHDELTSLPGRRAFNDRLLRLEAPYAVAVVDIDHFKNFNDTYGHDTGDQVLRMVAGRLARVADGGVAYRVGGEEFTILFQGQSMRRVVPHLEMLRAQIEDSKFRVRGLPERRTVARGPDRRNEGKKAGKNRRASKIEGPIQTDNLSVTVSIGVAEAGSSSQPVEDVIQAADKALYRAKHAGRNRVETAGPRRTRSPRLKRSTA